MHAHASDRYRRRAGDGDCGSTLRRGAEAVLEDATGNNIPWNHAASAASAIGRSARAMGGTSGALYNIFFTAAAGKAAWLSSSQIGVMHPGRPEWGSGWGIVAPVTESDICKALASAAALPRENLFCLCGHAGPQTLKAVLSSRSALGCSISMPRLSLLAAGIPGAREQGLLSCDHASFGTSFLALLNVSCTHWQLPSRPHPQRSTRTVHRQRQRGPLHCAVGRGRCSTTGAPAPGTGPCWMRCCRPWMRSTPH